MQYYLLIQAAGVMQRRFLITGLFLIIFLTCFGILDLAVALEPGFQGDGHPSESTTTSGAAF